MAAKGDFEKDRNASDALILAEIDRTMKKHTDNLMHVMENVSARLNQLESRTCHLDSSVDDLKVYVGNNHGNTDRKMKQLENILNEIRLKKEQEEKEVRRRYKAQSHLYTIIKVASDENILEQIGKDIYFDLVDHDKVRSFRIQKKSPFLAFKEEVAKEFGIPVQYQRFWLWAKRQNNTYRPRRPLTSQEEGQSVGELRENSNKAQNAELKLFLEVEYGQDLRPILPLDKTQDDILLFFKLYDPEKGELRYVGKLLVKHSGHPIDYIEKLNQMAGFSPDEEIDLYEEIKFEPCVMCEQLDKRFSFRSSELEDGDIICFQKSPPIQIQEACRCPDVPSFLKYVQKRQIVRFRSLERPKEDYFCLELSKIHNYDDIVERVARKIGLEDPSKIRLTSHNCYSHQPKPQPVKYPGVEHLSEMLIDYNQTSDILYYEVLDFPLHELKGLKNLKVAFHHATKDEVVTHNIRLPKQSTVEDVIHELKKKVELSRPNAELRLLEAFHHKIYKVFPPNEKIENINDQYCTLRAEEIPEEEKNLGPNDRLIHVYHFTRETAQNLRVQNFGVPFFLVIREGETLAEVKMRIRKKLQVPDEEFSKWKFAFLSVGLLEYLQESDIVFTRFQRRDVYGDWEQYLGLEHCDNTPCKSDFMDLDQLPNNNGVNNKLDAFPDYIFQPTRPVSTLDSNTKKSGSLASLEPAQGILEKDRNALNASILAEIDLTMKKHTDNLMENVSARLTQLENSVDDLKVYVENNHGNTENGAARRYFEIFK